jgi:broad specificity phosphatase PhoE
MLVSVILFSCSHTYYIVRHAEKAAPVPGSMMGNDVPLSAKGEQRAEELKNILHGKKIGYIFSTNFNRTRSTAKPLSDATGIPVQLYGSDTLPGFISMLKTLKKNTLVVGHSNTIDDIANGLCNAVKVNGDFPDSAYGNLLVVRYRGKKIFFEHRYYGTSLR